jgi:lipopolysaccharide transport system ATP-binding protein
MKPIIEVKDLSKAYRLGTLGAKSFADDVRSLWRKMTGKSEPLNPKVREQLEKQGSSNRINPNRKNEFWALRDVNFEIQPGEVVGIIGHNGAGKSTLLKILSRITEPTTGEITIRGRVSSLLEVGTGFHPDLTGRENAYLNGAIHGMTRAEIDAKFDEIVEFAQIQDFVDTPVKRYSSGMYVRLAFAVAAYLEPEILIIDEVLAVGDAEFQSRCLAKMKDVARKGRTVIFVSHIMTSVKALCGRCYLLEDGGISAEGGTIEMIDKYLTRGHIIDNDGEIDPQAYLYDTGEAHLVSISLSDGSGEIKNSFFYRDPFHIHLRIRVFKPLETVIFSVYVCSMDGTPLSFASSVDDPSINFSLGLGEYVVQVRTDSKMLPGMYSVKAAIAHPNGDAICSVERACEFKVERFARDDRLNYQWTRSNAYNMMPAIWEMETLEKVT